jgi:hypothetical protein
MEAGAAGTRIGAEERKIVKIEERAMQLWSVLVLAARSQQLLGYATLADLTNLPNQMGNFLGPVAAYCIKNDLPQITSIVVSQETGKPGTYYPGKDAIADQWKSFVFDWMEHIRKCKPTSDSFKQ